MNSIIPEDSRYIPFVQQQSCCVVACILMVMYRRGIPLVAQELLGHHLGLIVSPEKKNLFWNVRIGERPQAGYGTQVFAELYEPNKVFRKLKIPLKFIVHHIDSFPNEKVFKKFLVDAVKAGRDLLVCFDHGTLNNEEKHSGHVCVIDRVYLSKNLVRIIDPSANRPKWRLVEIEHLRKAMQLHPADGGSLWEL